MTGRAVSRGEAIERFRSRVDASAGLDACHPWTGAVTPNGYGHVNIKALGGDREAHAVAYELAYGEIPVNPDTGRKLDIDHRCHNEDPSCPRGKKCHHRRCCNELHLETKTRSANLLAANEGHSSGRFSEVCPAGIHLMNKENAGQAVRRSGKDKGRKIKYCKPCMREKSYARRRGVPRPGPINERVRSPKDESGKFTSYPA